MLNYLVPLKQQIGFVKIPETIRDTMERHTVVNDPDLDAILAADEWARQQAEKIIKGY